MPQNGIHGLVGIAVARRWCVRLPSDVRGTAAVGLVMGAMLPDGDLYPASLLYLAGRPDLLYVIHRTFTHSLLAILIVAAAGCLIQRNAKVSWLLRGAAVGMVTHSVLDIFFWFSAVDLFWPLSHYPPDHPWLPVIDLWKGFRLPPVFGRPHLLANLLTAGETAAVALYLSRLRVLTSGEASRRRMRIWQQWMWGVFVLDAAGAVVLEPGAETLLVMAPLLLFFLPCCWIATVRWGARILG